MNKGLIIVLIASIFIACQKQPALETINAQSSQNNSNQETISKLIDYINHKISPSSNNRIALELSLPIDGLEQSLEDALTATICHKYPGGGESKVFSFEPVFTFKIDHDSLGNATIDGQQVSNFINTCIDTIVKISSNSTFGSNGLKMVQVLEIQAMNESYD